MKIEELLEICYGKDYKHLNQGKYPILGTGGIMGYVDDYLYSGESILIGRKGTIDKPKFINDSFWTVDTLFYTKINEGIPKFIYYQLTNINWLKYNEASGVPSLSANNIKKIRIKLPSKEEQLKVANFLTKIDKKIELLEKKKFEFDKTKYAILKDISEKILVESDDKQINKLFEIKKGKGLSKDKVAKEGKYPAILYGELYTTYNEIIESTTSFTDFDEGFLSKKGDILIPGSTTTKGIDLVTASVVCNDNIQLGGDINILRKKENLNSIYVATYMKYCMKREILRLTQGSTIIHLYGKDLKNLQIKLPSIEIQNNIANFIKFYNTKEKLYGEQLIKLNNFKKSLLQKMFV